MLSLIYSTPEAKQRLDNTQAFSHRERQLVPLCSPDNFQSPGQLPEEQASAGRDPGGPRNEAGMAATQTTPTPSRGTSTRRQNMGLIESAKAEAWREAPTTNSTIDCDLGKPLELLVSHSPPQ